MIDSRLENSILAGRYRLVSLLGQGGMGAVWRAQHLELRTDVAVKLIEPSLAANAEMLERFSREARAAASLRSRHIVQVMDSGVDPVTKQPFIAMELLSGESLGDRLARVGMLDARNMVRLLAPVCRAMQRAHQQGIIHRDLKPDNLFLVDEDDEEIIKIVDFGIAKMVNRSGVQTATGLSMGTPLYMSPEQAEGRAVDHRTDIWALAVIAFQCLVGRLPFQGETLAEVLMAICARPAPIPSSLGAVLPGFDEWFLRGVERDVSRRFQSGSEMATALEALVGVGAGGEVSAAPPVAAGEETDAQPSPAGPTFATTREPVSYDSDPDSVRSTLEQTLDRSFLRRFWPVLATAAIGGTAGVLWLDRDGRVPGPPSPSASSSGAAAPSQTSPVAMVSSTASPTAADAALDAAPSATTTATAPKPFPTTNGAGGRDPRLSGSGGASHVTPVVSSGGSQPVRPIPTREHSDEEKPPDRDPTRSEATPLPEALVGCRYNPFSGNLERAEGNTAKFRCVQDRFTGALRRR